MLMIAMTMYAVPLVLGAFKFTSMPSGGGYRSGLVSRKAVNESDIALRSGGYSLEELRNRGDGICTRQRGKSLGS